MTIERTPGPCDSFSQIRGLRASTLGRADAARQVLVFMGMSACVERFELQRFSLLATSWDAQVTVVDTPGFGYGGATLTRTERRDLRHGHFDAVARRMVDVAQVHHHRLGSEPVTVVGYSMGASLACAIAADPHLLRIASMILVEPVAIRRWNLARLVGSVWAEDAVCHRYLAANINIPDVVAPIEHRDTPPPVRCRYDLAHLGYALSRGRLLADILQANKCQGIPLQIVHGGDSRLSRPADVARAIDVCRSKGLKIYDIAVAGRHPLWHSLPDVAALAERTLANWPDESRPRRPVPDHAMRKASSVHPRSE